MRPPLAGRRAAARRLAEQVRRRLEPVERILPVKRAPMPTAAPAPVPAPAPAPAPAPGDAAARIDAARERLRATIEPPAEADEARGPGA
jgi:hypothetical protein